MLLNLPTVSTKSRATQRLIRCHLNTAIDSANRPGRWFHPPWPNTADELLFPYRPECFRIGFALNSYYPSYATGATVRNCYWIAFELRVCAATDTLVEVNECAPDRFSVTGSRRDVLLAVSWLERYFPLLSTQFDDGCYEAILLKEPPGNPRQANAS